MTNETTAAAGLKGVVIGESRLSSVNGEIGKLIYCGYNIMDLAEYATFEEVVYLLWNGSLPTQAQLDNLKSELKSYRALSPDVIKIMKDFPKDGHPMAVLRTAVSLLSLYDAEAEDNSHESNLRKAKYLVSQMASLVATWERIRNGQEPIAPNNDLDHAANFLYMMKGTVPSAEEADAVDAYLILSADHGLNASTFASRVTTSTLSDMYSAIVSGIGTLKGPAHGGANQKAMEQFISIGSADNVDKWFDDLMASGGRIMGIGHRVYKAEDPRGIVLRARAKAIAESGTESEWFEIASKLEARARAHEFFIERNLYANVDYYSAIVLRSVGIPVDEFTTIFAMSRIAGWSAHVMEQWANNVLIRPRAEYVGEMDLPWVAIEDRG